MNEVRRVLLRNLRELSGVPLEELLVRRRKKYRRIAEVPGRFPRVL
jgi:acetyl-CoA carboxylase alpha subunit